MSNIEVVGLGALNMDNIYQVDFILGDGETAVDVEHVVRTPRYREAEPKRLGNFPGGSAANTIYGLAKLGVNTGFIGVVGDDAEGKVLLKDFQKVRVDTSQIRVKPDVKTGLARCFSDKLNFRSIHVTPGANSLLTIDGIDLGYINQAEILHISSFADDTQLEVLLELVDKFDSSVKISFSPGELYATKGLKTLTPILARTYVLFINDKEIEQLTGEDIKTGAETCLKQGCHIVVVTLGRGMRLELGRETTAVGYIRDAENEYTIEPHTQDIVSEVDTTGAGDAFAAGFLYGLLKGKDLEQCGRLGDITAQFSITKVGAREEFPISTELSQRYQKLYNKQL